jgi:hypothetical protein
VRVIVHTRLWLRDADPGEQVDRVLAGDLLGHLVVQPVGLDDLLADGVEGMQRRKRVLEDHRHPLAAQQPHLLRTRAHQFLAAQPDLAGHLGALVQSQDRQARHALARTGLTHDAQRFAAFQRERQPVHGLHQPVRGGKVHPEILQLQEELTHEYRTLGSMTA